jgi:hypothetical protein
MQRVIIIGAVALTGCGGASFMLKSPVADQCKDAGLKGCEQLTDGVLGFVDGSDKEAAKQKLAKGAAQNEPAELASFAAKLKTVAKLPGLDGFWPQLSEVATLLEGGSGGMGATPPPARSAGETGARASAPTAGNDDARTRTTTAIVAGHARAYACNPMGKTSQAYVGATCLRLGIGPLVVTDLVAGGACAGDVVVLSGGVDAPTWVLAAAPREHLGMHGARLIVAAEDELVVAVRSAGPLARDAACGVTVSTRKP